MKIDDLLLEFECILDPFDSHFMLRAVDGEDIEATRDIRSHPMVRQVVLGGRHQPILFVMVDAFHPAAEEFIASSSDLDEDQTFFVLHDQIDLPLATSIVAGEGNESFSCQPAFCEGLRRPTDAMGEDRLHDSGGASVGIGSFGGRVSSALEGESVISTDPESESISGHRIGTPS